MTCKPLSLVRFVCALFVLSVWPFGDAAAELAPAKGEELKTMLTDLLVQQEQQFRAQGIDFESEGELEIKNEQNYFAVKFPHYAFMTPDGSRLELGSFILNAAPGDTPEQWKMTLAIPTPLILYNKTRKPLFIVDFPSQQFAGIWHSKANNFIKLKAVYKNFSVSDGAQKSQFVIPALRLLNDLKKEEDNRWSGPSKMEIEGLHAGIDDTGGSIDIGKVSFQAEVDRYSFDALADYQEKMAALVESQGAMSSMGTPSPEHVLAIYNMVFDFLTTAFDGFATRIVLEDLNVKPMGASMPGAGSVKINEFGYSFGMEGFLDQNVGMNFGLGFRGLKSDLLPQEFKEAVPNYAKLHLNANKLPFKEVVDLGRQSLTMMAENPEAAQILGMQIMMMLPQMLTEAGTNIEVKDNGFGNEHYDVKIDGTLTADLTAVLSVVGQGKVTIHGLPKLMEIARTYTESPMVDETRSAEIQKTIAGLTMLEMIGQQQTDERGRPVRVYDFVVTKDGQTLLNGSDLKSLFGTSMKAEEKTAPEEEKAAEVTVEVEDQAEGTGTEVEVTVEEGTEDVQVDVDVSVETEEPVVTEEAEATDESNEETATEEAVETEPEAEDMPEEMTEEPETTEESSSQPE